MKKKSITIIMLCFSLLFAISLLSITFSEFAWAEESGETLVHADPATFQKNWDLTPAQKEYTIRECEKVVSALEKTKPDMSDLEKYFALALWADQRVEYDWDFWYNGYNFDFYRHQWDAYGAMDEDETSVCVGIAIFYSNLCHAADLPCRFVRTNPDFLEHTINYIPDINGNAYYADITENVFLMSGESSDSFEPEIDKDFAYIPKTGPGSCIDTAFDYRDRPGGDLESSDLKEFYNKDVTYDEWFGEYADPPTYEDWFREYVNHQTYEKWFSEYADHQNTDKLFEKDYEEKGSGLLRTDPESYHAPYHSYISNFVDPTADPTSVWFLDDFYEDPAAIRTKILNREFDEQLLDVSGLERNYDCATIEELKTAVEKNISIRYFPTSEGGEIVAKSAELTKDADYEVIYAGHDEQENDEVFTIKSTSDGEYRGDFQIHVKWRSAEVVSKPVCNRGLVYNKELQPLVEPGEAKNGEMQYALGTATEPTEDFTSAIPTAKNAGKYYVWYKVAGDAGHTSTKPQYVGETVSIAPVKLRLILEDMRIRVGETGVISPKIDTDDPDLRIPVKYTFESWQEDIATVTEDGVVTGLKKGAAVICVGVNPKYSSSNYSFSNSNTLLVYVVSDTVDIEQTKVELSESAFTYNGEVQKPSIITIKGLDLKEGTDFEATWPNDSKNAGTYTVTIKGTGGYTGTTNATYTIYKAKNPITIKAKTVKVGQKKLKKKAKTFTASKVLTVSKAEGKLSYKLVSVKKGKKNFKKKISVNAKTGKVTVKKGLKKGTYKVKVEVRAAGDANYNASAAKTVTFKIIVQ